MHDLIIVGAGGFGRELHAWLHDVFPVEEYRFKGFLSQRDDPDEPARGASAAGHPDILADPMEYQPQDNDRFLLAIGDLAARRRVTASLTAKGAQFVNYIHPTAIVAATVTIGRGAVVYPYAVVSHGVQLGDFVHLSLYASAGHDSRAGQNCYLSPYATLNGAARIGDDVFLGSHATVGPGVQIGCRSKVAANSCALRDAPADSFIFGSPGRCVAISSDGDRVD